MPSFKLIDDDLEEAAEDDCKIIPGHTIFDHIRKKAKDFPAVKKSSAIHFPTSETSNTSERQHYGHPDINEDATVNQETTDVLESTGTFHPHIEVNKKGFRRLEHILDHVRKRSKNLPVIYKPNTKEGSFPGVQGNFSDKEQTLSHMNVVKLIETHSNEPPVGSLTFTNPETIANEYNASSPAGTFKDKRQASSTPRRSLDLPFEVFSNQPSRTSTAKPSFNYSLSRKDIQFEPPGDSAEPKSSNILNHMMAANRRSCSLETRDRTRNANSFLGFKSVFSFL